MLVWMWSNWNSYPLLLGDTREKSRTGNTNLGWQRSSEVRGIYCKGTGNNLLGWWKVYFGYTVCILVKNNLIGVPVVVQWFTNPTRNHEVEGSILGFAHGLMIWCCRELWCRFRHSSDPTLLWLWRRPVATAPIGPLAWEPPYAEGAAQEIAKKKKRKKKKKK